MSYQFNIGAVTDRIMYLMKTTFLVPDGNSITLVGEDPQPIDVSKLPSGLIELEGAETLKNSPAVKDLTNTFTMYCWLVRRTDHGADDVSILRNHLIDLAKILQNDKRLNGTVTYSRLRGIDWSGTSRDWPVQFMTGLQAGYVSIEVQISIQ